MFKSKIDHKTVGKFLAEYATPTAIVIGAFVLSLSFMTSADVLARAVKSQTTAQNAVKSAAPANPTVQQGTGVNLNPRNDAASEGNKNAKVTIVEFSDFQCPYCEKFYSETYQQLKSKYIDTGKVQLVFRHFPLPFHQDAQAAAQAAECAGTQGKFWEYHDLLFQKGQDDSNGLSQNALIQYAQQLGLNKSNFNSCLTSDASAAIVNQDKSDAASAGITGTPTFIINGRKLVGAQPLSAFEAIIEQELKK